MKPKYASIDTLTFYVLSLIYNIHNAILKTGIPLEYGAISYC